MRNGWKLYELGCKKPSTFNFVHALRTYEKMELIYCELERKNTPPVFLQQARKTLDDGAQRILFKFGPHEQKFETVANFLTIAHDSIQNIAVKITTFPNTIGTIIAGFAASVFIESSEPSAPFRFALLLSSALGMQLGFIVNTCNEALERFRQMKPKQEGSTAQ